MFFSDTILTRKGPLASIWLAAHWDRRLNKSQIVQADLTESIREVLSGGLPPMALRLSGQLLLGASKIYGRKARYLLDDCTDALSRLRLTAAQAGPGARQQVDLPDARAAPSAINIAPSGARTGAAGNTVAAGTLTLEDFDLDEFLREEPAVLPSKAEASRARTKMGNQGGFVPAPPLSFGGGAGDDLLGEFAGMIDDVEVGRRATDARPSITTALTPEAARLNLSPVGAVDEGMEDELRSLKGSLPFSPLRTPGAAAVVDDTGYGGIDDYDQPMAAAGDHQQLPFSSPSQKAARRRTRAEPGSAGKRRRRNIASLLDEETEMSNSQMQAQLRDASALLEPSAEDGPRGSAGGALTGALDMTLADLLSRPGALLLPGALAPAADQFVGLFPAASAASVAAEPAEAQEAVVDYGAADGYGYDLEPARVSLESIKISSPLPASTHSQPLSQQPQEKADVSAKWRSVFSAVSGPVTLNSLVSVSHPLLALTGRVDEERSGRGLFPYAPVCR